MLRVHGTSASAPVAAAMVSLVNNERLLAGKGPVGFINPVLYNNLEVVEDVVHGENTGCGVRHGFRAVEGWDATTGLGSPNYERLLRFVHVPCLLVDSSGNLFGSILTTLPRQSLEVAKHGSTSASTLHSCNNGAKDGNCIDPNLE